MEVSGINSNQPAQERMSSPSTQRRVAEEFETVFLSEMLKYSGVNKTSQSFGGGPGEEAFASMLNDAYAEALVSAGGIGIADLVYKSMVEKTSAGKEANQ